MAKQKQIRKKKRPSKKRKKPSFRNSLSKAVAALAIVAVLVTAIGVLVYHLAPPKKTPADLPVSKAAKSGQPPVTKKQTFEIYPEEKKPARREPGKHSGAGRKITPCCADCR